MTDDERAAIERAVQRCCKACEDWRGDSHPPDEDVLADIIAAELSPLLDKRERNYRQLEARLMATTNLLSQQNQERAEAMARQRFGDDPEGERT